MTPKGFVSNSSPPPGTMGAVSKDKIEFKTSSFRRKPKEGGSVTMSTVTRGSNAEKKVGLNGPLVFNRLDAAANGGMSSSIANYDDDVSLDSIIQNIYNYLLTSDAPTPNVSTVKKETGGANMADEFKSCADICSGMVAQHQVTTDTEEGIPILFTRYDRKIDLPPRRLGQSELMSLEISGSVMNRRHPPSSSMRLVPHSLTSLRANYND